MSNPSVAPAPAPRAPRILRAAVVALTLVLLAAAEGAAQTPTPDAATPTEPVGSQGGRFGLGFASSWPSYGLSGTMQVNDAITAEAVVGLLGTVSNLGGRVWYRFNQAPARDFYGYGAAGLYRYDYSVVGVSDTESVVGLGGGVGVESGLRHLFDDESFPPIFINAEVGIAIASFEYYNFSALNFGMGIHYRFGQR